MKLLFFDFLVSSNTLCLQTTKKAYFWTADSFQHNTFHLQNSSQYLFDKHCIENNFMHSKATNDKQTERGGETVCSLFFAFPPWFGLQIFFRPWFVFFVCLVFFWNHVKIVHPIPKWVDTWSHSWKGKVNIKVGLLEATRFTANEVNFLKGIVTGEMSWYARLDRWKEPI